MHIYRQQRGLHRLKLAADQQLTEHAVHGKIMSNCVTVTRITFEMQLTKNTVIMIDH
jgi:hypothetical protein